MAVTFKRKPSHCIVWHATGMVQHTTLLKKCCHLLFYEDMRPKRKCAGFVPTNDGTAGMTRAVASTDSQYIRRCNAFALARGKSLLVTCMTFGRTRWRAKHQQVTGNVHTEDSMGPFAHRHKAGIISMHYGSDCSRFRSSMPNGSKPPTGIMGHSGRSFRSSLELIIPRVCTAHPEYKCYLSAVVS